MLKSFFGKTEKILKNNTIKLSNTFKTIEDDLTNEKYFCCPKCKQRISIVLNPENFSLSYNCQNNHKESNINYNIFYKNKNFVCQEPELFCQQCKKEKLLHNNLLSCSTCHLQLCINCILNHKYLYSHNNFGISDNSINKCKKHEIDISQYCKTCNKNLCVFCLKKDEKNVHNNHEIINFSVLIPDKTEIKKNNKKLEEKITKNNSIIDKLDKWKKEMISLVDEIIYNLKSEIMINKIIIQNFNWKYLDYINYLNYKNAIGSLEITNEKLENFFTAKMFIGQTTAINNYLFGENKIIENNEQNEENNIINEKEDKNNINNEKNEENDKNIFSMINNKENEEKKNNFNLINFEENEKKPEIEEPNINIINILSNGNALLCGKNNIYTYSLNNNEFTKIMEHKIEESNAVNNSLEINNKKIYDNLINLVNSISNKSEDYNILIWKMEKDLCEDKLFKLLNNENKKEEIKNEENKSTNNTNTNTNTNINNNVEEKKNIVNIFENINDNKEEKKENNHEKKEDNNNNLFNNLNLTLNNLYNNNNNLNTNPFLSINNNNSIESNRALLFNNNYNNLAENKTNTFINSTHDNSNANYNLFDYNNFNRIERKQEEYVYISRTGYKYHGRPQCGRMKSSTRVTLSKAEAMGLGPCLKCY